MISKIREVSKIPDSEIKKLKNVFLDFLSFKGLFLIFEDFMTFLG